MTARPEPVAIEVARAEIERILSVGLDPDLLEQALTHRSYAHENGGPPTNERLEFLGDSVLGLIVSDIFYRNHPDLPGGQLAKLRASVINMRVLADAARRLDLGRFLRLGRDEEATGGRDKSSILADALEALIGVIYVGKGLDEAFRVVHRLLGERISEVPHPRWRPAETARMQTALREALHDHVKYGAATTPQLLPVTIYLADETAREAVQQAVSELFEAFGLEETGTIEPVHGSWMKRLLLRSRTAATSETAKEIGIEVRRAVELHGIHLAQAEVDEKKAAAASSLIQALADQPKAAIMIGSLLLLKVGDALTVRELTQRELAHLERNPALLQDPATLLVALQRTPLDTFPPIEGTP